MEDALAQKTIIIRTKKRCLNPCCNGRCTRTAKSVFDIELFGKVLILVVMEDALAR